MGVAISLLFLLRKKWLYYTLNVFNFLILIVPTVLVIIGAHQQNTTLIGIGVLTVYPTGLLFVYALNRFNSDIDDVLLYYTLAAFIELVLLVVIGLSILSEDGSFLDVFSGVTPIDAPVGSDEKQAKRRLKKKRKEVSI